MGATAMDRAANSAPWSGKMWVEGCRIPRRSSAWVYQFWILATRAGAAEAHAVRTPSLP